MLNTHRQRLLAELRLRVQTLCRRAQVGDEHVTLKGLGRQSGEALRRLGHSIHGSLESCSPIRLQISALFAPFRVVHRTVAAADAGVAALQASAGSLFSKSFISSQETVAGKGGSSTVSVPLADSSAKLTGPAQTQQLRAALSWVN